MFRSFHFIKKDMRIVIGNEHTNHLKLPHPARDFARIDVGRINGAKPLSVKTSRLENVANAFASVKINLVEFYNEASVSVTASYE